MTILEKQDDKSLPPRHGLGGFLDEHLASRVPGKGVETMVGSPRVMSQQESHDSIIMGFLTERQSRNFLLQCGGDGWQ